MKTQRKFGLYAALLAAATLFLACTNGTQSTPPPPQSNGLTIKFDSTVACKKRYLGNESDVTTGAEVKEGDWYRFTALGLTADEKVENWYINGNKQFFETHATFTYNIKKSDADYKNTPEIKWNFTKFVIARDGTVVARFEPTASMADVEACIVAQL